MFILNFEPENLSAYSVQHIYICIKVLVPQRSLNHLPCLLFFIFFIFLCFFAFLLLLFVLVLIIQKQAFTSLFLLYFFFILSFLTLSKLTVITFKTAIPFSNFDSQLSWFPSFPKDYTSKTFQSSRHGSTPFFGNSISSTLTCPTHLLLS